jgi:hypothetical protein
MTRPIAMTRPACTTGRAVLAIAGAALAIAAAAGCGSGGGTSQQAARKAQAPPPTNKLLATVSTTGSQVTLTDSNDRAVTRLRSGWYTIFVTVNAKGADFHLTGPSVDSATKANVPGVALWGFHFLKGTYRYMNDRDASATTHVLSVY